MKKLVRAFFLLRRGEQRALISATIFLLFALFVRIWLNQLTIPDPGTGTEFSTAMVELERRLSEGYKTLDRRKVPETGRVAPVLSLAPFRFDPNKITKDSLRSMHLPEFVSKNLISYREAGGVFKTPGDLRKIYGMDSVLFKKLEPYILISPEAGHSKKTAVVREKTGEIRQLELNSVDSSALALLPGISPWFASRIIKYRDLLGGFHDTLQYREVYGMDSARYRILTSRCRIDTMTLSGIDINLATFRELVSHPYISREETLAILQYREFADSIQDPRELLYNQIIDPERFRKMYPYFNKN